MIILQSIFGSNFSSMIDDFLESMSLNTDFGKIVISIVVVVLITGIIAYKRGSVLSIFFAALICILFFTALGWFPFWTLILLSIIILLILFVFNGGGSTND